MKQAFEVEHTGQETKGGIDDHAFAPCLDRTHLQVAQWFTRFDKPLVTQGNGVALMLVCQWAKTLVMHVRRIPRPSDHLPVCIHQPTQLYSNYPTPIRHAFLAQRLLRYIVYKEPCRIGQKYTLSDCPFGG